jgi:hypothetical protein
MMGKEVDDPRREWLLRALSLGLFAGANLGGLFQASHALGEVPKKLPAGRSIYQLRGDVLVDGAPADLDTKIGPDSRLKTGDDSRIIFVVASDAFVLRSNSELEMSSIGGLLIDGMRILSGRILSVFGKRAGIHNITTTTATIGIRGTGVYVESDPEKSYVCTCYGRSSIVANADPNVREDVLATHHDEPLYILRKAPGNRLIVPGPVINHTDAELILLEKLVGRTPPFAKGGGYGLGEKRNY